MDKLKNDINGLMDEYLKLNDSPENRRRLACWEPEVCARDQWHGRAIEGAFAADGLAPLTVDLQNPLWLQVFPQDLAHTYTDPEAYLRFYLQKRIYQFKEFQDDTPLEPIIPIWLHTPFEMSLFSMPYHYYADKDPLIDLDKPVCANSAELEAMPPVDFHEAGMMPMAHRIYEGIREIAGDSFLVLFPEWTRGPFGVALALGGYNNVLLAMMRDPDYYHGLMGRITEERKTYFHQRAKIHSDQGIPPGSLFNDEIDATILGPSHYHNFIKPYEDDLAQFHDRVSYWHSCGNTANVVKEVVSNHRIDVLDVSGYTDLEEVLKELGSPEPRLDIRLHPLRDLQDAAPEWMEKRLIETNESCRRHGVKSMSIRVSGLNPWKSPREDFDQIRRWIGIARRVADKTVH
jgi:hypothetical protein